MDMLYNLVIVVLVVAVIVVAAEVRYTLGSRALPWAFFQGKSQWKSQGNSCSDFFNLEIVI